MMPDDLRLERQGDALIVQSKHNRWHGAAGIGFALYFIWLFYYGTRIPPAGCVRCVLALQWFMIVVPAGIGVFLWLPREVITTFDLRSHRVVHHVSIGRGWYERRRTYAFAEIAGLGLKGYDAETDSYMPVMTLRNGETRRLSTAKRSYLICAMTIEAICAVTGLQKLGVAHR